MAEGSLAAEARAVIEDEAEAVFVSAATVWEIEIKRSLGRLEAPDDLATAVRDAGYSALQISFEHAVEAARLPRVHADPFDRMLVAQARVEGMTLATCDSEIRSYEVASFEVLPG